MLVEILRGIGKIHFTTQADQALVLALSVMPDIIILDIEMPQINGIEVCRQIKQNPELAHVPVLFITSHADDALEAKAFAVGAADFICKPPHPTTIRARVSNTLALKQRTDQLHMLAQTVEQGRESVLITDRDGNINYVNPTFVRNTGYSREEVIGRNPRLMRSGFTDPKRFEQLWQALTAGQSWQGELINRRKNGELFFEEVTVSPIRNANDEVTHYIAIQHEIPHQTERVRAANTALLANLRSEQQKKTESEALFKAVFENSLVGLAQLDLDGHFVKINQEFASMVGLQCHEIIDSALTFAQLTPPSDYSTIAACIHHLRNRGAANHVSEVRLVRLDGQHLWVNLFIKLFEQPQHETSYFIVAAVDISAHVESAQQIERSNKQLRTLAANLQNVRESERIRLSRELHDELGQVLTALRMRLLQLSENPGLSQVELQQQISALTAGVAGAIDTTRSIANALRPSILDTLDLAAAVRTETQALGKRLGIRCHCSAPDSHIKLPEAVTSHVYRVFQEATTNIARHARASRVEVVLQIAADTLSLSITDNGIGIHPERRSSLSLGLTGMQERALYLGGSLSIGTPASHSGTCLRMSIPLGHPLDSETSPAGAACLP